MLEENISGKFSGKTAKRDRQKGIFLLIQRACSSHFFPILAGIEKLAKFL